MKSFVNKVIVLSMLFSLVAFFFVVGYKNQISYSATTTLTRSELQKMVLATAYSYLNNKRFSEYDQLSMDASKSGDLTSSTINWRNYNVSPEAINRTNYYHTDCAAFATTVYMYSLGYDFSEYYNKSTSAYYKYNTSTNSFTKYLSKSSKSNYLDGVKYFGKGSTTEFMTNVGQLNGSDTIVAYYKKLNGGGVSSTIIEQLKKELQPGDIFVYRGESNGHAMLYVGDLIDKNNKGFIHSTGSDYKVDGTTLTQIGDDDNSVRYAGMIEAEKRLKNGNVFSVTILRPINKYCTSNTNCKVDSAIVSKLRARVELLGLRTEQYVRSYNSTINTNFNNNVNKNLWSTSEYNSVNIGETLQYSLYLRNNSKINYCYGSGYYNYENSCESNGHSWKTSTATAKTFSGLVITAKLPNNVTYVSNSCTGYSCSYDKNNHTITWNMEKASLSNESEKTIRFNVKVNSGSKVIFNGFKIKNLQMDSLQTNINPTISKLNADSMRKNINNFKKLVDNKKIKYVSSGTSVYKIDLSNNSSSGNVSQYGFVKSIYWNTMGIDLDYLSGANIKNAIFNVDSYSNYSKKTEAEINKLTNTTSKNINKMLVKGFYGGRYLRGNDNKDRTGRLRIADLEFGDIIVYFYKESGTIAKTSSMFMYLGTDKNSSPDVFVENEKNSYFVRFNSDGTIGLYTIDSSKTSYKLFNELYSKDLFVVLRPSQLYGTTVNYSGANISGEDVSVEYQKYRNLNTPTSSDIYKVDLVYNKDNYTCNNCKSSYTGDKTFNGWYSDSKYSKRVSNGSSLISNNTHTLYAKWNYKVITLPNPTIPGYTLEGWYSDSNFKNMVGKPNDKYTINSNKKLYAKWKANTYKVKYDANGGVGTMGDSIHTYDSSLSLNINKYTNAGYTFYGWSKEKNGALVYQDGETIKNLTTGTNTVTLYAVWGKMSTNLVEVTLKVNNGTATRYKQSIKKGEFAMFNVTPNKGYGNGKVDCNNSKIRDNSVIISNVSKNMTCTLTYEANTYEIIYNANGGTGTMKNSNHTYDEKSRLNQNKYTKNGYKFLGWSRTLNGKIEYRDLDVILNVTDKKEKITLYAVWNPINYNIQYDLNGGKVEKIKFSYNIETNNFDLPIPYKAGYKFVGWTGSNGSKPQKIVTISKGTIGNKKYVANYEKGKYKISYETDEFGIINGIKEEFIEYKNAPSGTTYQSKENYKVLKWYVNKNVKLKDGTVIFRNAPISMEQIRNIVVEDDLIITLSHYYESKHLVSYLNGENGKIVGITNEEVASLSNPLGTDVLPNPGFEFSNWIASKNVMLTTGENIVSGSPIFDITKIIIKEDITLIPQYEVGEYHITYLSDENSEITGLNYETIYYPNKPNGTFVQMLVDDYVFDYWYADVDITLDTGEVILAGDPISNGELKQLIVVSDITLTSKTRKTYYLINYINSDNNYITDTLLEKVNVGDYIKGPIIRGDYSKNIVFKANEDVELKNGKTIKKGDVITLEELKMIILTKDMIFILSFQENSFITLIKNKYFIIYLISFLVLVVITIIYFILKNKKNKKIFFDKGEF